MKLRKLHKKGMSLAGAPGLIALLVVIGIVGAIGLSVISGVQDTFVTNTANCGLNATGGTDNVNYDGCGAAYNATEKANDSVSNFFNLAPVLGTVLIAVILLAAVGGLVYYAYNKQ